VAGDHRTEVEVADRAAGEPTELQVDQAVATELGVGTMSLYRYVRDRDELEILVGALVLADVDLATTGTPRQQVAELARRARATVAAHPAAIPLLIAHRPRIAGSLEWGDAVVRAYAAAGLDPQARALALRALIAYLFGALLLETGAPLDGEATQRIAASPHPLLSESARAAATVPAEQEFTHGLEALLDGLSLQS